MQWTGKIVGALIGLAMGRGVVGALIGFIVGHAFDQSMSRRDDDDVAPNRNPAETRAVFFRTTFAVMGHAAKADGRVSEQEILAARQIFQHLRLGEAETRAAMDCFARGKQPDFDLRGALAELSSACGRRHDLLRYFLEIQMRAALLGNGMQGPVRSLLGGVAGSLGISGIEFAHLEAVLRFQGYGGAQYGPQAGRSQAGSSRVAGHDLAEAYEILDVKPAASNSEIKQAYRRLMSQNHPDKLVARGLPESMLEIAKEKTQAIQAAYERIKEARGIR